MTPHEQTARELCAVLRAHGHRALLVGGCVRDTLLGSAPKDFDIATSATPDEITKIFPHTIPVGAMFGVILVVTETGPVEVATFRHDGPYLDGRHPSTVDFTDERHDATRRDFTINALYLDPATDEVLDYTGGRADLAAGIIRAIGDPATRFHEDHLRLLRAVRFAARLGFKIEPGTLAAVRSLAHLCTDTSPERVRDEILKMLTTGRARQAIELLDETGLLPHVLPELVPMKGCEQPPEFHPEGDVYVHTLMLLEQLGACTPTLALGALLHDVGKPATQTFEDRIRFNLHEKVGAVMARDFCRRYRLPNEVTDRVTWLVENHMRLAATPEMREAKRKRFVREPGFDELIELGRIDCLASHGNTDHIRWIEDYRANLKPEEVRPVPLLSGRDLIALGYTPGPLFKQILTQVEDLQLEGKVRDRESALAHVREAFPLPA